MLNNKGFAVSAVLYTILIAFLLFLGVALANFSAAANVISNANKDLVNGMDFKAIQVKPAGVVTYYDSSNIFQKPINPVDNKPYSVLCIKNGDRDASDVSLGEDNNGNLVFARKYWYETNTIVQIKSRYGTFYWPKDFPGASIDNYGVITNPGKNSYNGKINVTLTAGELEFCDIEISDCSDSFELVDICS